MRMKKQKQNSKDSVFNLFGEDGIGTFIAHSTTTEINQLCAFLTTGYTVSRVVKGLTSVKSWDVSYRPTMAKKMHKEVLARVAILQTFGSNSTQSNTTSRESQQESLPTSDGRNGQTTTSEFLVDTSSLTSTQTEQRLDTTRLDTMEREIEDLRSRVDAAQSATVLRYYQNADGTWSSQRVPAIPSYYECAEYLQSVYPVHPQEQFLNEWRNMQWSMDSLSSALETAMRQETN